MPTKEAKAKLIKAKSKTLAGVARNRLMAFAMDAEEAIKEGKDETGELAQAVEAIKNAAPLLEAIEDIKAVGESEEVGMDEETGKPTTPVGDTEQMPGDKRTTGGNGLDKDEDDDKDGKKGEGMDAKEVARIVDVAVKKALAGAGRGMDARDVVRAVADRDALVKKTAPFIADFANVAVAMDAQEVAEYAIKTLEIPAQKGAEVVALEAWLHNRKPAHQLPTAHTGDAADNTRKPSFLSKQIAERS